jgi:hypothetical protein
MFAREDLRCLAMPVRRNGETLAQLLPRFDLVVASTPVDDEFTDEVIRSWWNTQAIRKSRVGIGHIIESPWRSKHEAHPACLGPLAIRLCKRKQNLMPGCKKEFAYIEDRVDMSSNRKGG